MADKYFNRKKAGSYSVEVYTFLVDWNSLEQNFNESRNHLIRF